MTSHLLRVALVLCRVAVCGAGAPSPVPALAWWPAMAAKARIQMQRGLTCAAGSPAPMQHVATARHA